MNSSHKGKSVRWKAIYFNFRFDVGERNFNDTNEFVSNFYKEEKTKYQSTQSKFLFSLFDTSVMSRIVKRTQLLIRYFRSTKDFVKAFSSSSFGSCLSGAKFFDYYYQLLLSVHQYFDLL